MIQVRLASATLSPPAIDSTASAPIIRPGASRRLQQLHGRIKFELNVYTLFEPGMSGPTKSGKGVPWPGRMYARQEALAHTVQHAA
jgi:hypothetical protein